MTEKIIVTNHKFDNTFSVNQFLTGSYCTNFDVGCIESQDAKCSFKVINDDDDDVYDDLLRIKTFVIECKGVLSDKYVDGCLVTVPYNLDGKDCSAEFLITGIPYPNLPISIDPPAVRVPILKQGDVFQASIRISSEDHRIDIVDVEFDTDCNFIVPAIDKEKLTIELRINPNDEIGFIKLNIILNILVDNKMEKLFIPCSMIVISK